jgi:hypothetical protein
MYLDSQPVEKVEFFRNLLGQEAFDKLNIRAQIHWKVDEAAVALDLKQRIQDLDGGR